MSVNVFLPQIEQLINDVSRGGGVPVEDLAPDVARKQRQAFFKVLLGPARAVAFTKDFYIPVKDRRIFCRHYKPREDSNPGCLIYFHGGGWLVGNVESHDNLCRKLCLKADCNVISVDYSLSPEARFPVALQDCYESLCWIAENASSLGIDREMLAVGGDSAGGNLSASICLMSRDENGPRPKLQILAYPVLDLSNTDTASYRKYGDDLLLTRSTMLYFIAQYLKVPEQALDPYASPLLAKDLKNLPPALILLAEHDVLANEGEAYGKALEQAGNEVQTVVLPGTIHLFFGMEMLSDDENGLLLAASALKNAFQEKRNRESANDQ